MLKSETLGLKTEEGPVFNVPLFDKWSQIPAVFQLERELNITGICRISDSCRLYLKTFLTVKINTCHVGNNREGTMLLLFSAALSVKLLKWFAPVVWSNLAKLLQGTFELIIVSFYKSLKMSFYFLTSWEKEWRNEKRSSVIMAEGKTEEEEMSISSLLRIPVPWRSACREAEATNGTDEENKDVMERGMKRRTEEDERGRRTRWTAENGRGASLR